MESCRTSSPPSISFVPAFITITLLQVFWMKLMSWLMMTVILSCRPPISSTIIFLSVGWTPAVGSSRRMSLGFTTKTRPKLEQFLLSHRQLSGREVAQPIQSDQFERLLDTIVVDLSMHGDHRHAQVLVDGHLPKRLWYLKGPADSSPGELEGLQAIYPLAVEMYRSPVQLVHPADQVDQRGLAGSVRTYDPGHLIVLDRRREPIDDLDTIEDLCDIFQFEQVSNADLVKTSLISVFSSRPFAAIFGPRNCEWCPRSSSSNAVISVNSGFPFWFEVIK